MTRKEAAAQVFKAMKVKRLTFDTVAAVIDEDRLWIHATLIGQAHLSAADAAALACFLELGPEVAAALQAPALAGCSVRLSDPYRELFP